MAYLYSSTQKKDPAKTVSIFGINTDNAIGFDSLGSNLVKTNETHEIIPTKISLKYTIETVIKEHPSSQNCLKALQVDPVMAVSLWKTDDSYFKAMIQFCSQFPTGTPLFFIQLTKGKVVLPQQKVNPRITHRIKWIDYGYQMIIAVPLYKDEKSIREIEKGLLKSLSQDEESYFNRHILCQMICNGQISDSDQSMNEAIHQITTYRKFDDLGMPLQIHLDKGKKENENYWMFDLLHELTNVCNETTFEQRGSFDQCYRALEDIVRSFKKSRTRTSLNQQVLKESFMRYLALCQENRIEDYWPDDDFRLTMMDILDSIINHNQQIPSGISDILNRTTMGENRDLSVPLNHQRTINKIFNKQKVEETFPQDQSTEVTNFPVNSNKDEGKTRILATPKKSILTNPRYSLRKREFGSGSMTPETPTKTTTRNLNNEIVTPPLDHPKKFKVVFVGESGAGKSTLISGLSNYFSWPKFDKAKKQRMKLCIPVEFTVYSKDRAPIKVRAGKEEDNENFNDVGESVTQRPKKHFFGFGENAVEVLDTPGLRDSRGMEQDNRNLELIKEALEEQDEIHAVCIVLKSNESRLGPELELALKQLFSLLPRKYISTNLFFFFTFASGTFFGIGDITNPLEEFFRKNRIEFELTPENSCVVDSDAFKYLVTTEKGIIYSKNRTEDDFKYYWEETAENVKTFFDRIQKVIPVKKEQITLINRTTRLAVNLEHQLSINNQKIQRLLPTILKLFKHVYDNGLPLEAGAFNERLSKAAIKPKPYTNEFDLLSDIILLEKEIPRQ